MKKLLLYLLAIPLLFLFSCESDKNEPVVGPNFNEMVPAYSFRDNNGTKCDVYKLDLAQKVYFCQTDKKGKIFKTQMYLYPAMDPSAPSELKFKMTDISKSGNNLSFRFCPDTGLSSDNEHLHDALMTFDIGSIFNSTYTPATKIFAHGVESTLNNGETAITTLKGHLHLYDKNYNETKSFTCASGVPFLPPTAQSTSTFVMKGKYYYLSPHAANTRDDRKAVVYCYDDKKYGILNLPDYNSISKYLNKEYPDYAVQEKSFDLKYADGEISADFTCLISGKITSREVTASYYYDPLTFEQLRPKREVDFITYYDDESHLSGGYGNNRWFTVTSLNDCYITIYPRMTEHGRMFPVKDAVIEVKSGKDCCMINKIATTTKTFDGLTLTGYRLRITPQKEGKTVIVLRDKKFGVIDTYEISVPAFSSFFGSHYDYTQHTASKFQFYLGGASGTNIPKSFATIMGSNGTGKLIIFPFMRIDYKPTNITDVSIEVTSGKECFTIEKGGTVTRTFDGVSLTGYVLTLTPKKIGNTVVTLKDKKFGTIDTYTFIVLR